MTEKIFTLSQEEIAARITARSLSKEIYAELSACGECSRVINGKLFRFEWDDISAVDIWEGGTFYRWFPNEQLSPEERKQISDDIYRRAPNVILAHTCPLRKQPVEKFISKVDQASVDKTMEEWLDEIYAMCPRTDWYCGHWHTDKVDGNVTFMYEGVKIFC